MEVLICTFILSIGLMSLAALIPVGRYTIAETSKSDHGAACGRAAMRDIKIQRMLDYRIWVHPSINASTFGSQTSPLPPFVLDPIGRAKNMGTTLGTLPRVTLPYAGNGATNLQAQESAKRFFQWQDDGAYSIPGDAGLRPSAYYNYYYLNSAGQVQSIQSPNPDEAEPTNYTYRTPANNGAYSWLATVVPARSETQAANGLKRTFRVSVAVCYQRSFVDDTEASPARKAEEVTQVQFQAGGLGGGVVTTNTPVYVRDNEWVLVTDGKTDGTSQTHWYRVVSAGDRPSKMLMLEGPDWNVDTNSGGTQQATCIILQSVIGVYTTTMQLDSNNGLPDPMWLRW